jgi:hypothetical protein
MDGAHPVAKAVRAYLDLCFFHPFEDGNARAARLAFEWHLSLGPFSVADLDPIFRLPRVAGDRIAYLDLILLAVVLCETARTRTPRCQGLADTVGCRCAGGSWRPGAGYASRRPGSAGGADGQDADAAASGVDRDQSAPFWQVRVRTDGFEDLRRTTSGSGAFARTWTTLGPDACVRARMVPRSRSCVNTTCPFSTA